jgi:hypothetical protein
MRTPCFNLVRLSYSFFPCKRKAKGYKWSFHIEFVPLGAPYFSNLIYRGDMVVCTEICLKFDHSTAHTANISTHDGLPLLHLRP